MKKFINVLLTMVLVISVMGIGVLPSVEAAGQDEWKAIPSKTTEELGKVWTVSFSKEVDASSVKANENVIVIDSQLRKKEVRTEVSGKTIKVIPTTPYTAGQTYEMHILDSVSSVKGKVLQKTFFSFTVRPAAEGKDVSLFSAGTYGGTSSAVKTYEGNLYVESAGVTVKNAIVKGNLIVSENVGEGDVFFDNVKVTGETKISGGGPNSVHFKDSVLVTVIVNKNNGSIRVVAEGATTVEEVLLESSAVLESASATIKNVEISEGVQNSIGPVKLVGTFDTVNNRAAAVEIQLPGETSINELVLSALSHIKGQGLINRLNVTAKGNDSTVESRPQSVVLDISGHVTVGGEVIDESYSSVGQASLKDIQATMSYTRVDLQEPKYDLTAEDFIVTAKQDGRAVSLQNLQYNPNLQLFTYDPLPVMNGTVELTVSSNPASGAVAQGSVSKTFYSTEGFSGRITDIVGKGVANLTITLEDSYTRTVTDRNGYYSIEASPGVHHGTIGGPGFIQTNLVGTVTTGKFTTGVNETAIRAAASDEMKIMLSWNDMESDMDSHLTSENFHVYYGNRTYATEDSNGKYTEKVDLDWDDTDYYGPETTTIRKWEDGRYIFFLHNYSGEHPMDMSNSKVQVFQGNSPTPAYTFTVPADTKDDRYWGVFELFVSNNGGTVELKELNEMAAEQEWLINPYSALENLVQSAEESLQSDGLPGTAEQTEALRSAKAVLAKSQPTSKEIIGVLKRLSPLFKFQGVNSDGPLHAFVREQSDNQLPFEWKGFIRDSAYRDLRNDEQVTLSAKVYYYEEVGPQGYLNNQLIHLKSKATNAVKSVSTQPTYEWGYETEPEAVLFTGTYGELKNLYSTGFTMTTDIAEKMDTYYYIELYLNADDTYQYYMLGTPYK